MDKNTPTTSTVSLGLSFLKDVLLPKKTKTCATDRTVMFISRILILAGLLLLFIDWRLSVIALILLWNQFAIGTILNGRNGVVQFVLSVGVLVVFIYFFIA